MPEEGQKKYSPPKYKKIIFGLFLNSIGATIWFGQENKYFPYAGFYLQTNSGKAKTFKICRSFSGKVIGSKFQKACLTPPYIVSIKGERSHFV